MTGKLYVVGTPIGNLGDISSRCIETLQSVDFIAAEDTRVTLKLLNHFDIKKPLVSYFEHNMYQKGDLIVSRILSGENCAVVTDAGMPCISDPGEMLVKQCADAGVVVVVVPSPTAAASALAISGLPTSRFAFEGFLSTSKKSRDKHLKSIVSDTHTLIFYEAPHKLKKTLEDLYKVLGDRKIALCRELTKIHEEVIRTTLSSAQTLYDTTPPKGEFVIIIEGASEKEEETPDIETAIASAKKAVKDGVKKSVAAKEAAELYGFSKSDIYKALL